MILLNQGSGWDASYFWPIVFAVFIILLLIPLVLTIIGFKIRKRKPKTAKILFICAISYLIIGLGVCGIGVSN